MLYIEVATTRTMSQGAALLAETTRVAGVVDCDCCLLVCVDKKRDSRPWTGDSLLD
jgi:hypothetical protein